MRGSYTLLAARSLRVWKGEVLANEVIETGDIVPGLIVRHTSRRLGNLEDGEACERLISGSISFSEFVDQVGDGYKNILDFMMDHDLHPSRLEEIVFCIDCYAEAEEKDLLLAQLAQIYSHDRRQAVG
jgi:hypothetical protein